MSSDVGEAVAFVTRLVVEHGRERAREFVEKIAAELSVVELAALAIDNRFWATPKQIAPVGDWRTWGFLTGRGFGKTDSIAKHITEEVEAGRARCIGMAAQKEERTLAVQVQGLIAAAPPKFRPQFMSSTNTLVWPNGAVGFAFTPESPDTIRSPNLDLAWLSEVQSWPTATRAEAVANFQFATRVGYARTIWDATPKKGHPILKRWIARAAKNPEKHVLVRGTIYENPYLGRDVVSDLEDEYGGTSKGREELLGEMLDESERALVKQKWIDDHRRHLPTTFVRRVISVDPAVTNRTGNDRTGIVDEGLGVDGQVYVCGDRSGKFGPDEWANVVLDLYIDGRCDCVVVETNKGGDLVAQVLRAAAGARGLRVVVLAKDETPRHQPGTVFVREVHARGAKEDRAQPLATAYERGKVSHVYGVNLTELEELLTTWEPTPGQRSPDALDALVHGTVELLGLAVNKPDNRATMRGLKEAGEQLLRPARTRTNIAALLGGGGGGRI